MPLFNYSLTWVILFVIQLVILSFISNKLFNRIYLFLHRFFKKDSTVVLVVSFVFLPGTFIHELCHALTAVLLGSAVRSFSVWPRVEGDSIKMGYAEVEVLDIFRNSLIGIAPLLFGSMILYYLSSIFLTVSLVYKFVLLYLIFQISNSMFLSPADVKEVRILLFLTLFLIVTVYIINFYFYKISFIPQDPTFLLNNWYLTNLKLINIFMLFPLLLNSFLLLLAKFFITHKRY